MNSKKPFPANQGPLSEADERALDALFGETQNLTPSPPDFTEAILRQLAIHQAKAANQVNAPHTALSNASETKVRVESAPSVAIQRRRNRRTRFVWIASGVALAASILVMVNKAGEFRFQEPGGLAQTNNPKSPTQNSVAQDSIAQSPASATKNADPRSLTVDVESANPSLAASPTEPPRGIPMVRQDQTVEPTDPARTIAGITEQVVAAEVKVPVEITASLARFDESLATYWQRIGVTPAEAISNQALADRIERRFGIRPQVSDEQIEIEDELTNERGSMELASRLVDRFFKGVPLVGDVKAKLIEDAADVIEQGHGFDHLVADWISDSSIFDRSVPNRLTESIAANLLGVDAACARCHDSPVDGRLAQHDYWAFAAAFSKTDRPSLFYEMSDGRQRIAEPSMPKRWFVAGDVEADSPEVSNEETDPIVKQFATSLIGSRTLASTIANHLWDIGLGAPLISRASDPAASPWDDTLQNAHREITDLLLTSNFDIRAATELVMASNAMRRGESELVQSDRLRLADEKAIVDDAMAIRTFAASRWTPSTVKRDVLVAMMSTRLGNAPRGLGESDALLAQPMIDANAKPPSSAKSDKPSLEEQLWAAWLADRSLLKESWLHWIKDPNQQRRHVYYAANLPASGDDSRLIENLKSPQDNTASASEDVNDRLLWVLRQGR